MRSFRLAFLLILVVAVAYPQQAKAPSPLEKLVPGTVDLGVGAFENEHYPILLAIDASLVDLLIKDRYVMFIAYMAAKSENQGITVTEKNVSMTYNGQEYTMPTLEELNKNYKGEIRDLDFYRQLGKEGIISSWIRFYYFPERENFFPPLTRRAPLAVTQGYMYGYAGFRTPLYFKNPGFKKGDLLIIKVTDKDNPTKLYGQCGVKID